MIDVRGRSCPEPVIMVQKAVKSKEASYEVIADNKVSVENITRFAKHAGYDVSVKESGDDFHMTLSKK